MRRVTFAVAAALLMCCSSAPSLRAQEPSPIDDLISRARRALDDLEYARADSIARTFLQMTDPAQRAQRVAGLQMMAAALYPEEVAARRPDSALRYLRDLVRAAPDARIPREISWRGLDSLVEDVRANTFAVWAAPEGSYELVGPDGEGRIEVSASRPARFFLTAELAGDGPRTMVDSAGPGPDATLYLRALVGDRPILPWGAYTVRIIGIDTLSGEQIELAFAATVEAPPFALLSVPAAPDPSLLLPERAPRRAVRNGLLGLGLGAATAFVATSFGGGDQVGSAPHDRSVVLLGTGMALGALIGALLDPGHALPENIADNRELRNAFAEHVRDLRDENERRRTEYRATVTIDAARSP